MAKAQGVVALSVLEFSFPESDSKHDTKGKKYAFRASIRGKVFKSRYVFVKELGEQKGYFSGVTQEDTVVFSLRFRSALGSHTIGEASFLVPSPDKGTFRMSLDVYKKEKTTATVTIEVGYFPHGVSEKSWLASGLMSSTSMVSVDGKKHRDKDTGDGEEDGNEDLSDQGSEGDENSCSLDFAENSSLPSFTRSATELSDLGGGETKKGIIHKILKSSSKHTEKYATFLKRFGYTSEEALYTEYHVSFLKKQKQSIVSIQGILYRSSNFLSFYSNNFNQETIEKIKIENLMRVSLIENSLDEQIIRFGLDSGKELQFSAPKEENMFDNLLEEWEKNKLLPGNHLPLNITNIDIAQVEFLNRPKIDKISEDDPPSGSRCWQIVDASLAGFSVDHFLNSIVLGPDFEKAYHAKRGDGDICVSPWVEEPMTDDFPIFSRELTFQSKVKLKLQGVPPRSSILENQCYYQKEGSLYFEVVSTASGVPGCDSFRTETVWIVSPEEEGIRLTGRMMCRFLKRTHLMGQITSAFYQIGQYTYKIWCETAMEFLQEVSFHYDGDEELLSKADKKEERKSSEDKGKGKETQKSVVDLPNCSDIKEKRRGSIPGIGDGLVEEGRRGEDPLPPVVDNNTPVEPYLQANFTELGTCKFPDTTIQVAFEKIFSDKSEVVSNLHKKRKDWDVVTTEWVGEGRVKTRVTDFKFNIVSKIPGMPSEASAQEKQRYYYMGDQLFVEAKAVTFGVPYCDYFETETKYVVSTDGTGVVMQVSSGLYWMKKTWLLSKIETDTLAVQKENTNIFIEYSQAAFAGGEGGGGERGAGGGAAELQQDYGIAVPMESSGFLEQKLKEVGSATFPGVTVEEMYTKFWSDTPASVASQEEFHKRKQEIEFRMGKWERNEKYGNVKEMTYKTPSKVRMPGVPAYAPVTEKVRFSLTGSWLELENLIQTTGVPYSDYFLAEQRWKIVADGGGVVVSVYGGVRFLKKTWLQGKIEGETIKAMKEAVNIWIQQAQREVLGVGGEGGEKGGLEAGGVGGEVVRGGGEAEVVRGGGGGEFFDWKGILLGVLLFLYILLFIRFSMLVARVEELESELISFSSPADSLSSSTCTSPSPLEGSMNESMGLTE